jgi:hypothetical protein
MSRKQPQEEEWAGIGLADIHLEDLGVRDLVRDLFAQEVSMIARCLYATRSSPLYALAADTTTAAYQPPRQIPTGPRQGASSTFRPPSPEPSKPKPKGKRVMDSFLEEIKRYAIHQKAWGD